jgi:hypothetical protein
MSPVTRIPRIPRILRSIVAGAAVAGSLVLTAPALLGTAGAAPPDLTFDLTTSCNAGQATYTLDITNSGDPVDVDVQKYVSGGWNLVPKPGVGSAQVQQVTALNVIVRFAAYVDDVKVYDSGEVTSTDSACGIAVWPAGQGLTFDVAGECTEGSISWAVEITNSNQDPVPLKVKWQIDQGAQGSSDVMVTTTSTAGPTVAVGSITQIWVEDQLGRIIYDSGDLIATDSPECGRPAVHHVTATLVLQCIEGAPKIVFTVDNDGDYPELIEVTYATFDDSYSDGATVWVYPGTPHYEAASIPTDIQVLGEVNLKFPASPTPPLATLDATLASCSTSQENGGSEAPNTPPTGGGDPGLPRTGRTTAPIVALALVMILAGSALTASSRRTDG